MRSQVLLLTILIPLSCLAQYDYKTTLAARVKAIGEINVVDVGVVIFDESMNYGSDYQRWSFDQNFVVDDVVAYKGCVFRAVANSKGKDPFTSRNEWSVYHGLHPYLLLKDSAKIEDLRVLLHSKNVYVRIYAVAALAHRKQDDLFSYVQSQLADTSKIHQFSSDHGWTVCPGDLMLWFTMDQFSVEQKDQLKRRIVREFQHLDCLEQVLAHHNPHSDDYLYIKGIVSKKTAGVFGLIALAGYCKHEDIETIRTGFFLDLTYEGGHQFFYKAIENCPDKTFKADLIKADARSELYYIRALAAFKDPDCLRLLELIARDGSRQYRKDEYAAIVYDAMKRHYHPMYDPLIGELEKKRGKDDSVWEWYNRPTSRWDY
jgi:hypothetical protein